MTVLLAARPMIPAVNFVVAAENFAPMAFLQPDENTSVSLITRRDHGVLAGLCEGKSGQEIALGHDLQEVTAKLHVRTLSRKPRARNRTHAAMIARDKNQI